MDDPKDQHLGALEELKSFLKNFEFISAAFYKSLYHHFSELEDEPGRLLDGFNALSSLENTLGAALTKDDAIGEDVVVALYDLVKTFESLFHGKRIKEMLKHQAHQEAAEFAAKGEAERAATIKDKEIAEMAAKGAGEYVSSCS
ncbi:hypothetical protein TrVFT333_000211 [Trichoderma virens FT-333]|nr:hypothetical protein TrVFT333_000211 [Trichoderma virens FT-333]